MVILVTLKLYVLSSELGLISSMKNPNINNNQNILTLLLMHEDEKSNNRSNRTYVDLLWNIIKTRTSM